MDNHIKTTQCWVDRANALDAKWDVNVPQVEPSDQDSEKKSNGEMVDSTLSSSPTCKTLLLFTPTSPVAWNELDSESHDSTTPRRYHPISSQCNFSSHLPSMVLLYHYSLSSPTCVQQMSMFPPEALPMRRMISRSMTWMPFISALSRVVLGYSQSIVLVRDSIHSNKQWFNWDLVQILRDSE